MERSLEGDEEGPGGQAGQQHQEQGPPQAEALTKAFRLLISAIFNKCSNRNMEVTLLRNNDRPTDDGPTKRPTDGQKGSWGSYN